MGSLLLALALLAGTVSQPTHQTRSLTRYAGYAAMVAYDVDATLEATVSRDGSVIAAVGPAYFRLRGDAYALAVDSRHIGQATDSRTEAAWRLLRRALATEQEAITEATDTLPLIAAHQAIDAASQPDSTQRAMLRDVWQHVSRATAQTDHAYHAYWLALHTTKGH